MRDPNSGANYYVNDIGCLIWQVMRDPNSGANYYVNETTGASQWEPPQAAIPPPPPPPGAGAAPALPAG